jgi:hypothetical protein
VLQRKATAHEGESKQEEAGGSKIGLYIHIPYCRRRCRYCDFAIVPIGPRVSSDGSTESSLPQSTDDRATAGFLEMDQSYAKALLQEIDLVRQQIVATGDTATPKKISIASIYFGGGTPSLAPVETIKRILQAILEHDGPFCVEPGAEITIEMDPGTFTLEKAKSFRELGINRVSLGIQSFDDRILESIGRVHRREDITDALAILETAFGDDLNYSIDLISGLPGLSLAQWADTLDTALSLKPSPTHLSVYDLQIESVSNLGLSIGCFVFSSTRVLILLASLYRELSLVHGTPRPMPNGRRPSTEQRVGHQLVPCLCPRKTTRHSCTSTRPAFSEQRALNIMKSLPTRDFHHQTKGHLVGGVDTIKFIGPSTASGMPLVSVQRVTSGVY